MEKSKKENISIGKISELLKNAPTDDGTFYGCLYDLYVLIGIVKGVSDINIRRTRKRKRGIIWKL